MIVEQFRCSIVEQAGGEQDAGDEDQQGRDETTVAGFWYIESRTDATGQQEDKTQQAQDKCGGPEFGDAR